MKIDELAKNLSTTRLELENLGFDDEATKFEYSEAIKKIISEAQSECESLFHPEVSFASIIEHGLLSEIQKRELFKLFKEFSKLLRDYEIAKLENNLDNWMKSAISEWKNKKKVLLDINKYLSKQWNEEDTDKLILEYLG